MKCSFCGEPALREWRCRRLGKSKYGFSYQHQFWKCSGCGREWEDGAMHVANCDHASLGLPTAIESWHT
jgi:hypothetical protein